ncbi:MAG: D-alanine--poly(phosphoribitol) ligase subunit DltC [Lachnospiraceae bacterium]|jgi:D-alanine--poly(phosphoribitol) ligase subunit 2|nr:D-alanine--poly(phosphoribitol) ligase subunit DltC [Lachnospiraceae bacterium]MBP3754673.1 D-alanine--poly(phosphoribitol) ligase subunit DltC [Lachnospiraceae bacterium]
MKEDILEILAELCEDEVVKEEEDVELFESGLLDSMAYLELLMEIETRLGITISPSEVSKDDINTPAKFVEFVMNKA